MIYNTITVTDDDNCIICISLQNTAPDTFIYNAITVTDDVSCITCIYLQNTTVVLLVFLYRIWHQIRLYIMLLL